MQKRIGQNLFMAVIIVILTFHWSCLQQSNSDNHASTTESQYNTNNNQTKNNKMSELEKVLIKNGLVNIQEFDSTLIVNLVYSTTDNFVGIDVYDNLEKAYLHKPAAEMLIEAHKYLKEKHPDYRFIIWDAARPRAAQQIFWDSIDMPIEEKKYYVANPETGSVHNFGCAVDLSIIDTKTNQLLDMGTEFDDFSKIAWTNNEPQLIKEGKLTEEQFNNRMILRQTMQKAGFTTIKGEWWHFDALPYKEAKVKYGIIE